MQSILICTDLDRTLLPNGPDPESPSARPAFAAVADRPEVVLAYVTGRHRELVEAAMEEYEIPRPRFVIADVGSAIYDLDGEVWSPWEPWQKRLAEQWPEQTRARIQAILENRDELRPQEDERQSAFKLSYYGPVEPEPWLAEVRQSLVANGLGARSVHSLDEQEGIGLLDLLPEAAGKLGAVEYLMENRGFSRHRTLFAGDSGNDLEILCSDIPAVLVANCTEAVRRQALRAAAAQGHGQQLYVARGDFRGMNGNYSAGILEGLAHYLPETEGWMP